jgi:hypothetical protein
MGLDSGPETTLVFYGFSDQKTKVDIGDPGTGREQWDAWSLADLWEGEYLTLD